MRRISRLALAVGIAATLVSAGPAAAAPRGADASPAAVALRILDWVFGAVLGADQDAGPSSDPNGLTAGTSSDSGDQDTGHSIDPNG